MAAARRGRLGPDSRPRQFLPDLFQPGLHLRARGWVRQQPARLAGNRLPGHPALHQLGDHRAPGDQVHHRIKRHPHQQLSRHPTRRRHLVKGHHGGSQKRRLHRHRPAGGQRQVGVGHGVPAFPFNHSNRRAAHALPKKSGPGGGRGRQDQIQRLLPAEPLHGVQHRGQMPRGLAAPASGQYRY